MGGHSRLVGSNMISAYFEDTFRNSPRRRFSVSYEVSAFLGTYDS
jgi:hypothetical protein